jgi:nucleoside-diphosphate-sugar epimerase
VTDPIAAAHAARGGTVLYQCVNAPYAKWPKRFPPMQRGVLAAAEHTGALLVTLENVYGYGRTDGTPMTEEMPMAATTVKGLTRAAMTAELLTAAAAGRLRTTIGRAADFFGAGVTGSVLGERIFGNAVAGRKVDVIGDPDLPHTYSYVPDVAAGLAILGTDPRAEGQIWHLPGPQTMTTRQVLDQVAHEVGHPVEIRVLPTIALRVAGLVSPTIRGVAEMAYQFSEPFVLATTKYDDVFGTTATPMDAAIAETVAWWRTRAPTPR